jgi:hypothetical protein
VQSDTHGWHFLAQNSGGDVEHANHHQHQHEALRRCKIVPVRGYKQQDAGAEHKRAKTDSKNRGPAQTLLVRAVFEVADPFRGKRIDQARVNPTFKVLFPGHGFSCRWIMHQTSAKAS